MHHGKTDIFAGRLPVFTEVKHPTLADLHILAEDLRRCQAQLFVRQNLGRVHYLPWAALAKRLEPLFGSAVRNSQWELQRLVRDGILTRRKEADRKKLGYRVDDVVSYLARAGG